MTFDQEVLQGSDVDQKGYLTGMPLVSGILISGLSGTFRVCKIEVLMFEILDNIQKGILDQIWPLTGLLQV